MASERFHTAPAWTLGLGPVLTNFDVTAVVVALPALSRELALDRAGGLWVVDAYSLAFTGTLLAAGAIVDRRGRRGTLLIGNAVFLIASIGCGLAWSGAALWSARALQGVGAAFVTSAAIAALMQVHPAGPQRTRALATVGLMSGAAMALGPTLGGVIAGSVGWRWIFLANVVPCVLIALAVPRTVPDTGERIATPMDAIGLALVSAALLVWVITALHSEGSVPRTVVGAAAGAVLAATFVRRQATARHRLIDPRLFARRPIVLTAALLVTVSVGYWSVLVFLPSFLRAAVGLGETTTGIAMLAATLPMLLLPGLGRHLFDALGARRAFAIALGLVAIGDGCLALAAYGSGGLLPAPGVAGFALAGMVLAGSGAACSHPQLSGAIVGHVPLDRAGMASSVTVLFRQGGFAIGVAVLGAVTSATAGAVPDAMTGAAAGAGSAASFALAAAAAVVGIAASLRLPTDRASVDRGAPGDRRRAGRVG